MIIFIKQAPSNVLLSTLYVIHIIYKIKGHINNQPQNHKRISTKIRFNWKNCKNISYFQLQMHGPTVSQPTWLRSRILRCSVRRICSVFASSSTDLSMVWCSARVSTAMSTVSMFPLVWVRLRPPSTSPWVRSVSIWHEN